MEEQKCTIIIGPFHMYNVPKFEGNKNDKESIIFGDIFSFQIDIFIY